MEDCPSPKSWTLQKARDNERRQSVQDATLCSEQTWICRQWVFGKQHKPSSACANNPQSLFQKMYFLERMWARYFPFLPVEFSFVFSAISSLKLFVTDLALVVLRMNVLSFDLEILSDNRLLAH